MPKISIDKGDRFSVFCCVVAVLLVIFLACFIPLGPFKDYQAAQRRLQSLEKQLKLAIQTREEERINLQRQEELMARIRSRPSTFDLMRFISKVLRNSELDQRSNLKSYNQPSERLVENAENLSMVELELNGVNREELVGLLHEIYAADNLVMLHKLEYIRPSPDQEGLECSLTFITPKA